MEDKDSEIAALRVRGGPVIMTVVDPCTQTLSPGAYPIRIPFIILTLTYVYFHS
jgi:hypothetical protein